MLAREALAEGTVRAEVVLLAIETVYAWIRRFYGAFAEVAPEVSWGHGGRSSKFMKGLLSNAACQFGS